MASENHAGLLTSIEGRGQAVPSSGSLWNRAYPPTRAAGPGFLKDLDITQAKALQGRGWSL